MFTPQFTKHQMPIQPKVEKLLNEVIEEGNKVLSKQYKDEYHTYVDRRWTRPWASKLKLLRIVAGGLIAEWNEDLDYTDSQFASAVEDTLVALKTIKYAIENGLLTKYEDTVLAQAYDDLHEQGRQLFDNGYILPAAVLFRAILEERLRKLCEHRNCLPPKQRPGINDYNLALYANDPNTFEKVIMKHVDAMATVGNNAAHNLPLKTEDVERFMNDLPSFLARFTL